MQIPSSPSEIEEIKAALATLNQREQATRRHRSRPHPRPAPVQNELGELQSLLTENPDLGKLGELLARRLAARRRSLLALERQAGIEAQQEQPAAAMAFAAGVVARQHALGLLSGPFTSRFVTLDEPLLIWELPHPRLDIFRDSAVEPFGSWVKILLQATETPGGAQQTDFRFYFLWENPSDYYAVANASSSLSLNGQAVAWGSPGRLQGNTASLDVTAYLNVVRWSGWGTDPTTGQSNDQTAYPIYDFQSANKSVVSFDAYGGDWFDDPQPGSASFDPQMPYDMTARLLAIPGHAITMFEVGLRIDWWFSHDGETVDDQPQSITLDLANDALGYMARCPMVQLELLTAPSVAAPSSESSPG